MSTFTCDTCYDTCVIDHAGAEVACPDCQLVEIKLTGLSHGAGLYGVNYTTAVSYTSSTITFQAPTKGAILADVRRVRDAQVRTLGADHPDTLTTLGNLALAYRVAGRLPQATALLERVRDGMRQAVRLFLVFFRSEEVCEVLVFCC